MRDKTSRNRITNIGEEHVVVRRRHLYEMLRRLELELPAARAGYWRRSEQLRSQFERCGRYYVITRETWAVVIGAARGNYVGNGCQEWCENVCEGDGGCDLAGGTPGDCVAVCNNEEVYIQV